MSKVITIGSAVKDVFLVSKGFKLIKSDKFDTGVGECFAYGGKVELSDIIYDTGGGATNAAFTFTNLGISTGTVTRIGEDIFGEEIRGQLKSRRIADAGIAVDKKHKTGYSTILLSEKGDRTVLVYRGASRQLEESQLSATKMKADWYYLTSAGGNMPFNKKVFAIAQRNKARVFWNPGSKELAKGYKALRPLLKMTDVLSLNREETEKLLGSKNLKNNLKKLGESIGMVWVTDGKKGAYFHTGGQSYFVETLGTEPVNTTGAGDAFGSGFIAGMITKNDWMYAAAVAVWNADGVIREMGAKHGLLKKLPTQKMLKKLQISPYS